MLKNIIKLMLFGLMFFMCFFQTSFADSDIFNDFTLIDCLEGNDSNGLAFDSNKPYQTLKGGIENTINYINSYTNKSGVENSGLTFNIKIKCSSNNILFDYINLGFEGIGLNNELIIEGIGDNSFVINNIFFQNGSNILFKNIKFINTNPNKKCYFFNTNGIKILNGYFDLKYGENISCGGNYTSYYVNYSYFYNKIYLENTLLDIEINSNYNFGSLGKIKNSKINFNNFSGTGTYNIGLYLQTYNHMGRYNFIDNSIFISNEINFGGNNISFSDSSNLVFINNKFANVNNIYFSNNTVFINNLFENNLLSDISNLKNAYNNVFSGELIDNKDTNNYKKNYNINKIGPKGIAWFFKKSNTCNYFNTNTSSYKLYKEITGQEIPQNDKSVYIIYQ